MYPWTEVWIIVGAFSGPLLLLLATPRLRTLTKRAVCVIIRYGRGLVRHPFKEHTMKPLIQEHDFQNYKQLPRHIDGKPMIRPVADNLGPVEREMSNALLLAEILEKRRLREHNK